MGYRLPNLNWLRAFECAARLRSFTAAAEELNLTQAAVSHQIRSLESMPGTLINEDLAIRAPLPDAVNIVHWDAVIFRPVMQVCRAGRLFVGEGLDSAAIKR